MIFWSDPFQIRGDKMPNKFAPRTFNDFLCLVLVGVISALWTLSGLKTLELPAEVTGALIVTWTLLIQYYFRKKQGETPTKE
jgi:hypothetical protein